MGPSYQFRDEERALTLGYGGEIRLDPNYYHHDLGINYSFQYLYDFSKHLMLGLSCNANTFFKIPPSQKYLEENIQYSKYTAPLMASIGVNLFYKIK
jgi:hypothetical protein